MAYMTLGMGEELMADNVMTLPEGIALAALVVAFLWVAYLSLTVD